MAVGLLSTLRSAENGLRISPDLVDTAKLAPVFVPRSFFSPGNWSGPWTALRNRAIGMTWGLLLPDQALRYVDFAMAQYWEERQIPWKSLALANLARHTAEGLCTHVIRRRDGRIYAVAMMHQDGIGPSRILLRDRLESLFPEGYRVAVPEMSCALAFSKELDGFELATIQNTVAGCFQTGTRPLAPGLFDSEDLLPEIGNL